MVILVSALLIGSTSLIYGDEIISSILRQFNIGNIEVTQYDNNLSDNQSQAEGLSLEQMQEGFKGQLFDINGNEVLYGEAQEYYTKDGEFITSMLAKELDNGKYDFIISTENDTEGTVFASLEEAKNSVNKNINFPTYTPENYEFKQAIVDNNGDTVNIQYSNNQDNIVIIASAVKSSDAAILDDTPVTELTINGTKVVQSINSAFFEYNNISYQVYGNFADPNTQMDTNQMTQIIESIIK